DRRPQRGRAIRRPRRIRVGARVRPRRAAHGVHDGGVRGAIFQPRQSRRSLMSPAKNKQTSAKSTTSTKKTSKRFTDEELAAMKERAREVESERRRGSRATKADGETALLAAIAAMAAPDRAMAERLHAVIKDSAPELLPKTWYGMPAYAKDGKVVC